jgi:hypothetical protein
MYLTDLVFIEDGAPDLVDDGLINFSKLRKVAESIREIQQYQNGIYCLLPVEKIQQDLRNIREMDENEAYSLSLKCEKRETN